jgi:hypothetical protein
MFEKLLPQQDSDHTSDKRDDDHVCQYTLFGKPRERCIKCNRENPKVTIWRLLVVAAMQVPNCQVPTHPYMLPDENDEVLLTLREYKKAMRSKNF